MVSYLVFIYATGILLSIMLLGIKNGNNSANKYLAGFLFFSSLYCLSGYFFLFGNSISLIAIFSSAIPSFYFLIGPLSYFYVRSIINDDSKLSRLDYLHFALSLVTFFGSLPFLFSSWDYKLEVAESLMNGNLFNTDIHTNAFIPKQLNHIIRPFHTIIYIILSWQCFFNNRKIVKLYTNAFQYGLVYKWLFCFICFLTIAAFAYLYGLYNIVTIHDKKVFLENSRNTFIIFVIDYSLINLCLFLSPKIMYGLPVGRLNNNFPISVVSNASEHDFTYQNNEIADAPPPESKPSLFLFTKDYLDLMHLYLEKCMEEFRYLDPNFKMDTLCEDSGIPSHHWTYYFNEIKIRTFIEWKNNIRIEYAKKLINEGFLESKTFQCMALECGFATQSTFIRVFKAQTGMSPRDFIKPSKD